MKFSELKPGDIFNTKENRYIVVDESSLYKVVEGDQHVQVNTISLCHNPGVEYNPFFLKLLRF